MTIRLLDRATVGAIAAGEVIERPASVVKELVENALDAGATRIVVRIERGGLGAIDVSDNGAGIPPGDVARSVLRHATSKLIDASGLSAITTLGFRGEGLAAVAAVAATTVCSRQADADVATAVDAHGVDVGAVYALAAPIGTRVVARDLFAAVPARRAFLRGPVAEFGRIAQWLGMMAIAYPAVAFSLLHDERQIFAFGAGDIGSRLAYVFGREHDVMLPIEHEAAGVRVGGWLSSPGDDRADRRAQIAFVNGRLLRTTLFAGGWVAAYRTFAMTGRHAFGALFVEVAPDALDPNVHPTKSDVRLRDPERTLAIVRDAMSSTLRAAASARLGRALSFAPRAEPAQAEMPRDVPLLASAPPLLPPALLEAVPQRLRILAQVDRTYILATDGEAVIVIDQHAAHERVVYEQLLENARVAPARAEVLLVPYTFEVDAAQAIDLHRSLDALAAVGLAIEPFGERTFRISETPAALTYAGQTRRFDIAHFLEMLGDPNAPADAQHRVWASLACHSSARAGDALEVIEMERVVARLMSCENPMHCPHGRPTMIRLEPDALARLFRRV